MKNAKTISVWDILYINQRTIWFDHVRMYQFSVGEIWCRTINQNPHREYYDGSAVNPLYNVRCGNYGHGFQGKHPISDVSLFFNVAFQIHLLTSGRLENGRTKYKMNKKHQKAVDVEPSLGLVLLYSYHAQNLHYLSKVQVQLFDVGCLCVPGVRVQVCMSVYVREKETGMERWSVYACGCVSDVIVCVYTCYVI